MTETDVNNEIAIGEGMAVVLHFALKLSEDNIIDSNFDKKPASFVVGDGNFLPGFESAMFGLKAGAKASFVVSPENGFGQPNPNNIQEVDRKSFDASIELTQGLVVSFADAAGGELPGVVQSFDDRNVTIDFNHPLAGQDIIFDVEILSVSPSITH